MSKRRRLKVTAAQKRATHDELLVAGKDAYEELYGPITDWMLDEEFNAFEARSARKARQHTYRTRETPQGTLVANKTHGSKEVPRLMDEVTKARRRGRRT